MPEPEIARRCPSCGVSIRVHASFCPECGKPLPPKSEADIRAEATEVLTPGSVTPELTAETSESAPTQPLDSSGAIKSSDSAATMSLDSFAASNPPDLAATMPLDSFKASDPPDAGATMPLDSFVASNQLDAAATMSLDSFAATKPLDSSAATKPLDSRDTMAPPTVLSTVPSAPRHPRQATVGMGNRSGPLPRQVVGEGGLNRVEKFRQISTAVIDEASYDPSLRFVLVAAVLFVLFLVLLLLSELIT